MFGSGFSVLGLLGFWGCRVSSVLSSRFRVTIAGYAYGEFRDFVYVFKGWSFSKDSRVCTSQFYGAKMRFEAVGDCLGVLHRSDSAKPKSEIRSFEVVVLDDC